jgi:hypothetical protein
LRRATLPGENRDVKARFAVVIALAVGTGSAAPTATSQGASGLRAFSFTGAGTNYVNIQTGELRELWKGRAKPFGRITTHVAGWIQRPDPKSLTVRTSMVFVDPHGDVLIGACSGTGILPNPDGHEDWTCRATGGTGKFARSRGGWTLHIVIHRVSIANGTQKNRFTETGSGRITWKSGA